MSKTKSYKRKPQICRFCKGPFLTGGNGKQTVCYKDECRNMLERERRDREYARKKLQRQQLKGVPRQADAGSFRRLCLKCDLPISDGHLCQRCKRENQEYYVGVWNG